MKYVTSLGQDAVDGPILTCACNCARYELGYMQSCPLSGYPPEVVVISPDTGPGEVAHQTA